jgi:serine/threonine protein kinase
MDPLFSRGELVSEQYEIRDLLGRGSMGQVFDAHDVALNRRVALKAAFPHIDRGLTRKEAQGLAAVRHHGVTAVYGVGEHRGVPYFVMERLLGESLSSRIEARQIEGELFSVGEALDLLVPLAETLAAVHAAGIAHRDVKPANVMITVGERVVLTDFGIVAQERAVLPGMPVVGTFEYMAPETIRGAVEPGNAYLADAYAFGVLAYELVAGRRPFEAETVPEVLAMHLRDEPDALTLLRDDVPPLFESIVGELLQKDPLDRPHAMASVARRLRDPAMRSRTAMRSSPPEGVRITLPPRRRLAV